MQQAPGRLFVGPDGNPDRHGTALERQRDRELEQTPTQGEPPVPPPDVQMPYLTRIARVHRVQRGHHRAAESRSEPELGLARHVSTRVGDRPITDPLMAGGQADRHDDPASQSNAHHAPIHARALDSLETRSKPFANPRAAAIEPSGDSRGQRPAAPAVPADVDHAADHLIGLDALAGSGGRITSRDEPSLAAGVLHGDEAMAHERRAVAKRVAEHEQITVADCRWAHRFDSELVAFEERGIHAPARDAHAEHPGRCEHGGGIAQLEPLAGNARFHDQTSRAATRASKS